MLEDMKEAIELHCGYPVFADGMECQTLDVALSLIEGKHSVAHLIMALQSYDKDLNKKG